MDLDIAVILVVAVLVATVITFLVENVREHLRYNNPNRAFLLGVCSILAVLLVLFLLSIFMNENPEQTDIPRQISIAVEEPATKDFKRPSASPDLDDETGNSSVNPVVKNIASELKLSQTNSSGEESSGVGTDMENEIIENNNLAVEPQQKLDEDQVPEIRNQLMATETDPLDPASLLQEISVFLQNWSGAWEKSAGPEGDMETFSTFYAQDFKHRNTSRSDWLKDKARKNQRKSWIKVSLSDLKIELQPDGKTIEISFLQDYSSSNYSQKNLKKLLLIKENDNWQIISVKK